MSIFNQGIITSHPVQEPLPAKEIECGLESPPRDIHFRLCRPLPVALREPQSA